MKALILIYTVLVSTFAYAQTASPPLGTEKIHCKNAEGVAFDIEKPFTDNVAESKTLTITKLNVPAKFTTASGKEYELAKPIEMTSLLFDRPHQLVPNYVCRTSMIRVMFPKVSLDDRVNKDFDVKLEMSVTTSKNSPAIAVISATCKSEHAAKPGEKVEVERRPIDDKVHEVYFHRKKESDTSNK